MTGYLLDENQQNGLYVYSIAHYDCRRLSSWNEIIDHFKLKLNLGANRWWISLRADNIISAALPLS